MTPAARHRAPFELLRFTAAPAPGALVVLELDGRFAQQGGRFARQPVLVIEPGEDRPRRELAPVRSSLAAGRWHGAYAVPAEALGPATRLALGVRGTLLELPVPDEPDDGERATALAREANGLRRALEVAEADAAAARAEAAAADAELGAAVTAARDEALAESAERIDALEHEVVEAHRLAAADAARARTEADAARDAAIAATAAEHDQAVADATARAEAAEQHAEQAEERARGAERARAELEQRLAAAESGTEVLRAELAEERERAQADAAELEQELEVALARADALQRAAEQELGDADVPTIQTTDEDPTRSDDDDAYRDATRPLAGDRDEPDAGASPDGADDPDATRALTIVGPAHADAAAGVAGAGARVPRRDLDPTDPVDPADRRVRGHGATRRRRGPDLSRWIAVAALLLFAFVLLGLLLGFLG